MFIARRGLRLFLAALLVFSQQQAVLHLLGHGLAQLSTQSSAQSSAKSSTRQDPNDPQDLVCAKCLAIAHLDHVISGDVPTFQSVAIVHERIAEPDVAAIDLAFYASYRSRAPPLFS